MSITRPSYYGILASGFSPLSISGLRLWVKADSLGLTDGASVPTWADQSGNSNSFTQASAPNQPIYKTNIKNGLPIVRFDGVFSTMAKSSPTGLSGGAGMSIFMVVKQASLAVNKCYLSKWDYQTQGSWAFQTDSSTNTEMQIYVADSITDAGTNIQHSTNASLSANFFLIEMIYDGSLTNANRVKFYKNAGSALTTSTDGTIVTTLTTCTASLKLADFGGALTGTRLFAGDFGEILIYDSALSSGNRAKVETYLNNKWAIF